MYTYIYMHIYIICFVFDNIPLVACYLWWAQKLRLRSWKWDREEPRDPKTRSGHSVLAMALELWAIRHGPMVGSCAWSKWGNWVCFGVSIFFWQTQMDNGSSLVFQPIQQQLLLGIILYLFCIYFVNLCQPKGANSTETRFWAMRRWESFTLQRVHRC